MLSPEDYFDLEETEHKALFEGTEFVWDVLKKIKEYLAQNLKPGIYAEKEGESFFGENVYVGEGTMIEPGVYIQGPAWIGKNNIIRHGAYIRENVIVGDGCVLGNSCEFKNSLLFNEVEVPHFSYVGDSVLGYQAHLGAGVIVSNLKLDRSNIHIHCQDKNYDTGLRKFGAIVGDGAEVGCNSVLNPGSLLGKKSLVYPLTSWKGVLPEYSIAKSEEKMRIIPRHRG